MYGPGHDGVGHLEDLLTHFADLHRRLAEFVRRKFIYQEAVSVPVVCFDLDLFKRVLALIKKHIPALARASSPFSWTSTRTCSHFKRSSSTAHQAWSANSFSKSCPKVGTEETSSTTVGQELQEAHDYNRISLIYSVEDSAISLVT